MKCYSDPDYDWILNNLESNYIPNELENKLNDSFESNFFFFKLFLKHILFIYSFRYIDCNS